jgi:hypothetical protein
MKHKLEAIELNGQKIKVRKDSELYAEFVAQDGAKNKASKKPNKDK